jgi:copper/silver efflux system protein
MPVFTWISAPMVRDEDGLLVGYVYVDIDQKQGDIGGDVNEANEVVRKATERGEVKLPAGYDGRVT